MDKLLLKMISTSWGRNIIYTFLGVLIAGIAALSWFCLKPQNSLDDCQNERIQAERQFAQTRENLVRESVTVYTGFLSRIQALEEKAKTKKKR